MINGRNESRLERYNNKLHVAKTLPVHLACVNFLFDENFGYLARAAGCFGVDTINIIGSMPDRRKMRRLSGSLSDYVNIKIWKKPYHFLEEVRKNNGKVITAELCDNASSLNDYSFDFSCQNYIFVGHETHGVPTEIQHSGDLVYIPMPGIGYCLNTAQVANIMLYEAAKQYESK
jgi:tRNA(Leu) C34 or U34 (ribose-2'-O)-methylase TrmL